MPSASPTPNPTAAERALPSNSVPQRVLQDKLPLPYYAIADNISHFFANESNNRPSSLSAYSRGGVVKERTSWFPKRRMCKETCCVETVAVPLKHDARKIINWEDGNDLSDVFVNNYNPRQSKHLVYNSVPLFEEMLPCLVPNTIIYVSIDNYGFDQFFFNLRNRIHVPYTLIFSGTDHYAPWKAKPWMGDPLMTKLYGNNPRYPTKPKHVKTGNWTWEHAHKFVPINIGLTSNPVQHQEKYLERYLEMTNFQNPFQSKAWKQRYNFTANTNNPLDLENDVYVNFGWQRKERKLTWEVLCTNHTSNKTSSSCSWERKKITVDQIYRDASQYKFGMSPIGHGWDCHRTYEFLFLGVIPIVEEMAPEGYDLLEDLPVVHIPNMRHLTSKQDFVDAILNYTTSDAFVKGNFEKGWERLFLQYNRRRILKDSNREREILVDEDGNEFYQAYRYSAMNTNTTWESTYCPYSKEECRHNDTRWANNPAVSLSKQDQDWLDAWEKGSVTKR